MRGLDGVVDLAGGAEIIRRDDQLLHAAIPPRPQKVEEFHAFAQAALHHFRARDHLRHDGGDLGGAEIEFLVEVLDRIEDLAVAQVRIVQRRDLRAFLRQQIDFFVVEPAVFLRLPVQKGARIRGGERNLDRVRIDLLGEVQRLLNRLPGLAGQTRE